MKPKFIAGIALIAAIAISSCTSSKLAVNVKNDDDDVYYTKATAADQTLELPLPETAYSDDDNDYYYYDSYASRLNRFYYNSPFDYYDDFYYGYSPLYSYSPYAYSGLYLGLGYGGFGWGYGYYNPYYYSGFGYGYYPYSYWGTGYGYGGGGRWGIYSANSSYAGARPYRGPGFPATAKGTRIGYSGAYPATLSYPGRRSGITSVYGIRPTRGSENITRPAREAVSRQDYQPSYRPAPSSPSPSGGGSSGGGSSSGGGGRPSRP